MIKCAKMLRKYLGKDQKLVGKQVIKFWKRLKKYLFFNSVFSGAELGLFTCTTKSDGE